MRKEYHKELKKLEDDVVELARLAGKAVEASVVALDERDLERSKSIIEGDKVINAKRYEIEEKALLLIATQQPMAGDLRTLAAILNVIIDIERIGDYAGGNAKISLMIGEKGLLKPLVKIKKMSLLGVSMLERVMKCFEQRDAGEARALFAEDDAVDDLYDEVYKELLHMMIDNPKVIESATYLMWASHNLERVADRVTNIAERVVFMVTGKMEETGSSKY